MSKARLTALRLVGFKSFAERTVIEFGPGISAVVGPNGSGKSNLADALRWTLGEQGRSLRTRRAEDVIFAGSSSRRAIGMADVTIVVDNEDRLLPVDFSEVEIGRRLYRSGENEYLLNRQRVRLRDLVEMLDAGNLADNAFLFIGQGMVDQALALRPEERRPLFEEAAGVRRHERRRRQAEAELAEAESNLERLRDLLGELRPQARRLAAQAEQLEARRTAGLELAEALLLAARARWVAAEDVESRESRTLSTVRTAADAALADLHAAEEIAERTSQQMASHAELERQRRATLDAQRALIGELRVADARVASEAAAIDREAARVSAERDAVEGRLREAAVAASAAAPQHDPALAAELESVERALAELRPGGEVATDGDRAVAASQALATRRSEAEQHRRRAEEASSALATATAQLERLSGRLAEAETERDAAVTALADAVEAEAQAQTLLDELREKAHAATAALTSASERTHALEVEAAGERARLTALEAVLQSSVDEGLARAARARGGRLVAEGLEVEPRFRAAVAAALADAAVAFAIDDPVPLVAEPRKGTLVVRGDGKRPAAAASALAASTAQVVAAAQAVGGDRLTDAVRRDPHGVVTRLLGRAVWVRDMSAALKVASSLPAGWRAATLAGDVVTDEGVIRLATESNLLEQQGEREQLTARMADLDRRLGSESRALQDARKLAGMATQAATEAQKPLDDARAARMEAEERERLAQRRAEQWLREVTWERSRVERLTTEAASAEALAQRAAAGLAELERPSGDEPGDQAQDQQRAHRARLEHRRRELTSARTVEEKRLSAWHEAQRVAEVKRSIDETRLSELDAVLGQLSPRRNELSRRQAEIAARLSEAEAVELEATEQLDTVLAAGADDRTRLIEAERSAAQARERLRVAEQQSRRSEFAQMEARLQLEQLREGLLVELAGIGNDGLVAMAAVTGSTADADPENAPDAYEAALDAVIERWRSTPSESLDSPSANRLGTLRRRFHDLGAGNPFAAEEYAELRERLDGMEAQRVDLESAIASTRELIGSLNSLITDQFRRTFAALEDAFARRFHELFGGGDAELSLTLPDDLTATGVEIHARPPGKKRQPLSMLSGGERALTAVSLLLAMLEVRPVPFCVLDEVDAALDEANIGRFSKALRGLAEQTQFIVITHNRGTIEAADALYGVTLGDDAVSRVVSLRLPKPSTNGKSAREVVAESVDADAVEPTEAALA